MPGLPPILKRTSHTFRVFSSLDGSLENTARNTALNSQIQTQSQWLKVAMIRNEAAISFLLSSMKEIPQKYSKMNGVFPIALNIALDVFCVLVLGVPGVHWITSMRRDLKEQLERPHLRHQVRFDDVIWFRYGPPKPPTPSYHGNHASQLAAASAADLSPWLGIWPRSILSLGLDFALLCSICLERYILRKPSNMHNTSFWYEYTRIRETRRKPRERKKAKVGRDLSVKEMRIWSLVHNKADSD
ncbi:hypothetical protein MKEN_01035700 [Mycena kentingensis (nom. inval.)]|nr:hypothetical protein MKEN_01035700 [Mycena kentingensis (nom. inval.)]